MASDLRELLCQLETELHLTATRRNQVRLQELLHPNFEEFGRSGRRYSRDEVLYEVVTEREFAPIHAQDFELTELNEEVALLTYRSAHFDSVGNLYRHTLRSSVWVRTASGWKMRFHQGTPTDAFFVRRAMQARLHRANERSTGSSEIERNSPAKAKRRL